jgi:L-glyceraldehyde 3-phosphate reductase
VQSGRATYVGISSYGPARTREAVRLLREMGVRPLIHQPSYSMLNRWVEDGLLDVLEDEGLGMIGFTALAQGLLTDRYLDGVPEGSRAARYGAMGDLLTEDNLGRLRRLAAIAERRSQTLAQMALAWALRDPRVTSLVMGASSVAQLEQNVAALDRLDFTADELAEIDEHAVESGVDLWRTQSEVPADEV